MRVLISCNCAQDHSIPSEGQQFQRLWRDCLTREVMECQDKDGAFYIGKVIGMMCDVDLMLHQYRQRSVHNAIRQFWRVFAGRDDVKFCCALEGMSSSCNTFRVTVQYLHLRGNDAKTLRTLESYRRKWQENKWWKVRNLCSCVYCLCLTKEQRIQSCHPWVL